MKAKVWLSSASYYHLIVSTSKSDSDAHSSTHQGGLRQFQLKSTNESNKLQDLFSKGFADFNPRAFPQAERIAKSWYAYVISQRCIA